MPIENRGQIKDILQVRLWSHHECLRQLDLRIKLEELTGNDQSREKDKIQQALRQMEDKAKQDAIKKRMTVGDLREMIKLLPDDMEIVTDRFSDMDWVEKGSIELVSGVENDQQYIMRSHPTMSDENKANEKQYLSI